MSGMEEKQVMIGLEFPRWLGCGCLVFFIILSGLIAAVLFTR